MQRIIRNAIITTSMFLAGLALADERRVVGHMPPLPEELLNEPINLNCGGVINEWRGSEPNRALAEKYCTLAVTKFVPYLRSRGIDFEPKGEFHFDMAMLPDTFEYRGINDRDYRFAYRNADYAVTGYTSKTNRYLFNIANTNDPEWRVSFTHEMFHAMSFYWGLWDTHPGGSQDKLEREEDLAVGFTVYLGLGE